MKKDLPGLILFSIIFCLMAITLGSVSGQTGSGKTGYHKGAQADSSAQSLSEKIKIYPNPAKSELIADNIHGITMIEIFDVTGNKCLNEVCGEHEQAIIEVSQLKKGVYFIRFISAGATVMKRFIKE